MHGSTSQRGITTDAAWVLASQLASRGTLFGTGALVAWSTGPDLFSDYSFVANTSAVLATFFASGATTAVVRSVSRAVTATSSEGPAALLAALLVGGLGAIAAALLVVLAPAGLLPPAVAHLKWPLLATVGAQILSGLTASVLVGAGRFRAVAISSVASGAVLACLGVVGTTTRLPGLTIWAVPLAQFASLVLTGGAAVARGTFRDHCTAVAVLRQVPHSLKFSGPMYVTSIIATAGPWCIGQLLLATDKREFAAYAAALQWFSLVLVVPAALTNAYLPRLLKHDHRTGDDLLTARQLALANALQALLLAVVGAALLLVLSGYLTTLHGIVLQHRIGLFATFVSLAVLVAPINALGNGLVAQGGPVTWMFYSGVWLVILIACLLALPVDSAADAGLTLWLSYAGLALLTTWSALRSVQRRR